MKWLPRPQDPLRGLSLSKELGISPFTAQVLINRGFSGMKDAEEFLSPKLKDLKDPFDIPGMRKGCERVLLARERGEKTVIYGDYDVDGVTGTAILIEALRHLGMEPGYYIPHRYGEGYSLNIEAVRKLKDEGTKLIITDDCGISSAEEIKEANALGIDVIVTDHHNLPEKLPDAFCLINPKMIEGDHASRELSGAGVAFKFAWALMRCAGISENSFLTSLLDLAALGTIADVVPLTRENRIIARQGMSVIKQRRRAGIKALASVAGIKKELSMRDINFGLSPRINAAGRLEHASMSVDLLLSRDHFEAQRFAEELNRVNIRRQGIGETIHVDAFGRIDDVKAREENIVIISGENWHPGVIGIIASKLADTYFKPVVLIGVNGDTGRGSARSVEGFSVYELLMKCRDLFTDFGGHEAAAGFEIRTGDIPELVSRLKEEAAKSVFDFTPRLVIDAEIDPSFVTLGMVKELSILEPFGPGNPEPVFMSRGLVLAGIRQVGAKRAHLKLDLNGIDAIGFGMGKRADALKVNERYDAAYSLGTNEWNGSESIQFGLIDIIKP